MLELKGEKRVSEVATGMGRYHNSAKQMETIGDCVKHYEIPQGVWCGLEDKRY